jgi:hypothetical protein
MLACDSAIESGLEDEFPSNPVPLSALPPAKFTLSANVVHSKQFPQIER